MRILNIDGSEMKHAFLILTHNEFDVLAKLVAVLDHKKNDIFIHYDEKVKDISSLYTDSSKCITLKNRHDGRWGDYSLVEIELELLKSAVQEDSYDYFHIISGVHYPLKSMQEIHSIYESENKCMFQSLLTNEEEINHKMRRYHFLNRMMMSYAFGSCGYKLWRYLWNCILKIQKIFKIQRNRDFKFYKSSQWCTLTKDAVDYILAKEHEIKKRYYHTFCPDEYFLLSELMNSPLVGRIAFKENLLKQDWVSTHPKVYKLEDLDELMTSGCLYARKFSSESIDLLNRIDDYIQ